MNQAAPSTYLPTRVERAAVSLAIAALCFLTFTLPGRVGPESAGGLDPLGLAKLASRVLVIGFFLLAWRWNPDRLGRQHVFATYWPLVLFVGWALLSVAWSPLKTVSLGQALGLACLVTLSAWIAVACRTEDDLAMLLRRLWLACFLWCFVILAVNAVAPDLSGLDRYREIRGSNGLVKPTDAGATAGLGLVLTLVGPKLVRPFRLVWWFLPSLAVFGGLLLLSQSRTALVMTTLVGVFATLRFFDTRAHAKLLATTSCVLIAYLAVDPGFSIAGDGIDAGAEYLARGQTETQLSRVSGRAEMWSAVWREFLRSPWIGHGYFVTSETGRLNVWEGPANHTAHNLGLQVLVSTGVVGVTIFAFAVLHAGTRVYHLRFGTPLHRRVLMMTVLIGFWYAGWCQTCISFLGAIRIESVIFFTVLGIAAGQAADHDIRRLASVRTTA